MPSAMDDEDERLERSLDARLNYLEYLLAEPQMDQALEALAALQEEQRKTLLTFLKRLKPGDALEICDQRDSLVKAHDRV